MTINKLKWWAKFKITFALPMAVVGLIAFSNSDLNPANEIRDIGTGMETQPEGMVFIPQGSFVMKRSNGETKVERKITVDPFWMKETEVTVKEYFEFLRSIRGEVSPEEYQLLLPDFNKAPYKNYFTSKKYYNYPVVGVSYKQANLFCYWKTEDENKKIGREGKPAHHNYRLPIEAEWIYASLGGMQPEEIAYPEVTSLTKTGTGMTNEWGLYNIFNNVSEWTASSYVSNDSLLMPASSKYMVLYPGLEKEISKKEFVSPSGQKMEWQVITSKKYLQEDIEPTNKIVRGNNYKNQVPEGMDLDYHQSYDYVGFRYVTSYMGGRNE